MKYPQASVYNTAESIASLVGAPDLSIRGKADETLYRSYVYR